VNQFKRLRDVAICVALLAIPFFVLSAHLRDPARTNELDQTILSLTGNIQSFAAGAARWVGDVLEEYVFLVEVKRDNDRLRARLARLEQEREVLAAEGLENRRLRSLLQLRERLGGEVLAAQVIGKEVSPFFEVQRTLGRFSDVRLVVDSSFKADVTIQRTGARGILVGTGDEERYMARIQYLGREDALRVGDLVHTSGLGQHFPASILVGRVTSIVRQDFGLWQDVEVTPAVDFSSLEEVLILTEGSREEGFVEAQPEDSRPREP
jgi:rod shape-determining protein MreC